jgi:hypothetical protein
MLSEQNENKNENYFENANITTCKIAIILVMDH